MCVFVLTQFAGIPFGHPKQPTTHFRRCADSSESVTTHSLDFLGGFLGRAGNGSAMCRSGEGKRRAERFLVNIATRSKTRRAHSAPRNSGTHA